MQEHQGACAMTGIGRPGLSSSEEAGRSKVSLGSSDYVKHGLKGYLKSPQKLFFFFFSLLPVLPKEKILEKLGGKHSSKPFLK